MLTIFNYESMKIRENDEPDRIYDWKNHGIGSNCISISTGIISDKISFQNHEVLAITNNGS